MGGAIRFSVMKRCATGSDESTEWHTNCWLWAEVYSHVQDICVPAHGCTKLKQKHLPVKIQNLFVLQCDRWKTDAWIFFMVYTPCLNSLPSCLVMMFGSDASLAELRCTATLLALCYQCNITLPRLHASCFLDRTPVPLLVWPIQTDPHDNRRMTYQLAQLSVLPPHSQFKGASQ